MVRVYAPWDSWITVKIASRRNGAVRSPDPVPPRPCSSCVGRPGIHRLQRQGHSSGGGGALGTIRFRRPWVATIFLGVFPLFCSPRNLCGLVLFTLIVVGGTFSRAAEPKLSSVNGSLYRLHFLHTHT